MSLLSRVFNFYRDGFRSMVVGRTLWKIIIIKLVVMFGILKLFFFPDYLQTNYSNDRARAGHVLEVITRSAQVGYEYVNEKVATDRVVVPLALKSQTTRR